MSLVGLRLLQIICNPDFGLEVFSPRFDGSVKLRRALVDIVKRKGQTFD